MLKFVVLYQLLYPGCFVSVLPLLDQWNPRSFEKVRIYCTCKKIRGLLMAFILTNSNKFLTRCCLSLSCGKVQGRLNTVSLLYKWCYYLSGIIQEFPFLENHEALTKYYLLIVVPLPLPRKRNNWCEAACRAVGRTNPRGGGNRRTQVFTLVVR